MVKPWDSEKGKNDGICESVPRLSTGAAITTPAKMRRVIQERSIVDIREPKSRDPWGDGRRDKLKDPYLYLLCTFLYTIVQVIVIIRSVERTLLYFHCNKVRMEQVSIRAPGRLRVLYQEFIAGIFMIAVQ